MTPLFFLTLLGALSARGNVFYGYLDEVPSDPPIQYGRGRTEGFPE